MATGEGSAATIGKSVQIHGEPATRDEAFAACDFSTYRVLSQRFADEWDLVENEDGRWQSCSSD